jgi:hypothetical protein
VRRHGPAVPADLTQLIRDAAQELVEYQRLTAEGKLGEAGQRLDSLKQKRRTAAAGAAMRPPCDCDTDL